MNKITPFEYIDKTQVEDLLDALINVFPFEICYTLLDINENEYLTDREKIVEFIKTVKGVEK